MSPQNNYNDVTLESIARQKEEVLRKIRMRKANMVSSSKQLFAPIQPVAQKSNGIMKAVNTGMAMFDGLLIGLKIIKSIRKVFK